MVPSTPATERLRILVVEDDWLFARSLARVVERLGGEATVVGTVRAAAAQLADVDVWMALTLDVSLADGSGLDVLSRIRAVHRSVPALILTGLADHDVANAAFELHAEYLVKPVTTRQLEEFFCRVSITAKTRPPQAPAVSQDLPADLRKLAHDVLGAAATEGVAHAEYINRMALLARAASGRTHSGRSVTEACAAAVHISRSVFQEYTAVTARWSPAEVQTLLGRRDSCGHSITLFHLLTIVRAPRDVRPQLERVLRDGGDIRQLRLLRGRR